jgi:penicillin amidase
MPTIPRRLRQRRRRRIVLLVPALILVLLLGVAGRIWWLFEGSAPILEGMATLPGLSAPVTVARDSNGVPTIDAANRLDLARALGFLHGQERFFQMDLLRRSGAGELSELVGSAALPIDETHRRHRFRARAEGVLLRLSDEHRQLLDAYTAGVNAGLAALSAKPFEYALLRMTPQPWRSADTLLVVYAMYFDLQSSDGADQRRRGLANAALGAPLADFLYPRGTPADAALDGSLLPQPPMPGTAPAPSTVAPAGSPPPINGSNAFAVSGKLTATGAAMVANDMHLHLGVPDIWYRARQRVNAGGKPVVDLDGVTLPGTPFMVAGSNGKIAWGLTDSYIATGDLIRLDPVPGDPLAYQTPDGPKTLTAITEPICPAHDRCRDLRVEETVWGPVVGTDADGHRLVWRWVAQDASAIDYTGLLALETAGTVREALDAAHETAMPQQNFVVADHDGHIAWTIIGRVPKRLNLDENIPQSWADGSHGWAGYLPADEIPEIVDPPDGILWTANQRIVGGAALARLGDGGYAEAGRARQIRDDLAARDHFAEADLLAIQLDDRAPALARWQELLLGALARHTQDPRFARMLPYVRGWGGGAVVDSVGYRLVRSYEEVAVQLIYGGFGGPIRAAAGAEPVPLVAHQWNWPASELLRVRPAGLVPPPYGSWEKVDDAILAGLQARIDQEAGGTLAAFTWGARNHAGIHHPLAAVLPWLGHLTDPPDEPLSGDALQPRVVTPGFGASERFVVSPGHEADGILEMPGGEAGAPAAPYFLAGHRDWVEGRPSPFLPGPARWTLRLQPG